MGGGGGTSSTQSSGTSQQHGVHYYPEWYEAAGRENYAAGKAIANAPYEAFPGTVVPEFDPMTTNTLKWMEENAGRYQPMYDEAGNSIRDLMARGDVQRGDLAEYMNPYAANVEQRAIANAERSGNLATRKIRDQATQARAFGGSRQAIQEGIQQAETTRGIGDLSAQLREKTYDKGVQAQQADWARQFQNIASQKGLAESQIGAAKAAQQGQSTDYFNLLSGGKMMEDKQREKLEEVYKKFIEKRDWPKNMLTWLAGLLLGTKTREMEDITKTEQSTSRTKQSGSTDFGSILSGGGSLLTALAGLPSDRDLKTNIEKLGTDPKTKLPVYAYDYKADVESGKHIVGKRIGVMAQDVEKKYPKAVRKIAGKRIVDLSQLPLG